jgi:hypothetical protein
LALFQRRSIIRVRSLTTMPRPPLNLSSADFDPLPDRPLRTLRFWFGKAVSMPLWIALAVVYLLKRSD